MRNSFPYRLLVIGCMLTAPLGAAHAQTTTTSTTLPGLVHQICFKAKDSMRLRSADPAWLQVVNDQLGAQDCSIVGGTRYVCTPVTATVTAPVDASVANGPYAPTDLTPLPTEQRITQDRV